ncbi:MAG TPA: ParA family protein [Candidatus Micrarchaeia archaeon]|nr:ParA family protein [Candidatus Micrarchaeia archaeon]
MARPRILTVCNQKGGVGKTTTAINLGAALCERGRRVLLVDTDPQANATSGLGYPSRTVERSVYDVLVLGQPLADVIVPVERVPGLALAPASLALAGAELELADLARREFRLRYALEAVADYDYVLVDSPPSLALITVNCLVAADAMLIPLQCEYYALEGLSLLTHTHGLITQDLNPSLEMAGIVMTLFDPRTLLSAQVVAEVRRRFPDQTFSTIIPRTVRLSEAPSHGLPITLYDPSGRGSASYRALAAELLARDALVAA